MHVFIVIVEIRRLFVDYRELISGKLPSDQGYLHSKHIRDGISQSDIGQGKILDGELNISVVYEHGA